MTHSNIRPEIRAVVVECRRTETRISKGQFICMNRMNSFEFEHIFPFLSDEALLHHYDICLAQNLPEPYAPGQIAIHYQDHALRKFLPELVSRLRKACTKEQA